MVEIRLATNFSILKLYAMNKLRLSVYPCTPRGEVCSYFLAVDYFYIPVMVLPPINSRIMEVGGMASEDSGSKYDKCSINLSARLK